MRWLALWLVGGVVWPVLSVAADQKNVVVIVADDLGFQLGCYGDKQARTPHLDQLARESLRFTRAYCTSASCSASRSVILTGLYNHSTGHYGHAHAEGHFSTYETVRTLPVLMNEAGYRTCSIGKLHVVPEYIYKFQDFRNQNLPGGYRNPVRMAANARAWIEEDPSRPFFLYFCPVDPHRAGAASFANERDYPGIEPVRFEAETLQPPAWLPDRPEVRGEWAQFLQAIARFDAGVGALMQTLHETGHWDDTIVVFLSDNGPPFPGAKTTLYEPGANLPLLVRVPGSAQAGQVTETPVTWADLTPTILDLCNVAVPDAPAVRPLENSGKPNTSGPKVPYRFHGSSFAPLLRGETMDRDAIFLSHTFHEVQMYYPMRSVIQGKYKYINNIAHPLPFPFASDLQASPTWQGALARQDDDQLYGLRTVRDYLYRPQHELYDLTADPDELHNLADDPDHATILTDLQARLKAWQQATRDPWITKWDYE